MRDRKNIHLALCTSLALGWMVFGAWFGNDWRIDMAMAWGGNYFANWRASWVLIFVALIPGFVQMFSYAALIFHRRRKNVWIAATQPVTILVSAYNEEASIEATIESIIYQGYRGGMQLLVMDDGSTDGTREILEGMRYKCWNRGVEYKYISRPNKGKANSLNELMQMAKHDLIITVDGDCKLHDDAIKNLVKEKLATGYASVAGTVLVGNERDSLWTRMQRWEYCLGIYHVKKIQGYFGCTSVAQGAFSIYDKSVIEEAGGWKNTVGEDIVLSWDILAKNYRIGHASDAVCFTGVPKTASKLMGQRRRWARGMMEAIKSSPSIMKPTRRFAVFNWMLLMFPAVDMTYIFVLLPYMVAALLFDNYLIVGKMFYIVLATGIMLNLINYYHYIKITKELCIDVKHDPVAFVLYSTVYGFYSQACSILGYMDEYINPAKKDWMTK